MAQVKVLKSFTAYPDGKPERFAVGNADIPKALIDECNMLEKGLVALVKKKKPNEAD